ncbi:Na(+)/H(+) antiporter subunit D [ANME-1 cluster archaeon GoMg4]|nr:Na(+)/H(+) antiporter subunit D [ANME-1 cluster archaeon GoMg4]
MIEWLHPGFIYIFGALLIPFLKGKWQKAYLLLLPILAFIDLRCMTTGVFWRIPFLEYELIFGRVDKLSLVFAYIFVIASFCMTIYALHVDRSGEHVAAFIYVGCTLGVVFTGDLYTLVVFCELMAISSMFLIGLRGTRRSYQAGLRYIMVHILAGACLLGGVIIHVQATGSIAFDFIGLNSFASYFILTGLLINAAVPPLHAWLPDAYPEATITGAVFLTAFTTKSAIYMLIRGFPGAEVLIWLGAIMAVYGVVFAVLENDIRRLLAYHIVSQVGYMVCGVGIGTMMALDGAAAHAFCHILYKALLFMGAGAVIEVTGRSKFTELGGLYKYMPLTFWLYMIGAFSISGFPLFNGFVSKTMIVEASALSHLPIIWLLLEGASIGTFLHTGLKVPYLTWFSRKEPVCEAREPPKNMLVAMGFAAFLCTLLGVYPQILYRMLPYPVEYAPYAAGHVIGMTQLLLFTFVGFWLLRGMLHGTPTITLDTDWFYRIGMKKFVRFCEGPLMTFAKSVDSGVMKIASSFVWFSRNPTAATNIMVNSVAFIVFRPFNPVYKKYAQNIDELKKTYPGEPMQRVAVGTGVLLTLVFLAFYLLIYLVYA